MAAGNHFNYHHAKRGDIKFNLETKKFYAIGTPTARGKGIKILK